MSTRLFASAVGFSLANDADDARAVCVEAGRIKVACDLPDELLRDVTKEAMAGMPPAFQETLNTLMNKGVRGCVYPDPKGWVCIPLSSACPWLHHNATELMDCPACGAPAGQPCDDGEGHPIYEGTAHRRRVRVLVHENPEVLEHSLLPDDM